MTVNEGVDMQNLGLFRFIKPYFYSGLFDDPVLYVQIRPTGKGLLFDCGQIHHLAKRVLRSVEAVFISHAHMDHLMGFDHLIRHIHVAPGRIAVFGPVGIAERIDHKLSGYDWNLAEQNWCSVDVYEIHERDIKHVEFQGAKSFQSNVGKKIRRIGQTIYETTHCTVQAELCDHKIPSLIFRITERQAFLIDKQRLNAEHLQPGPWLKELKKRFCTGDLEDSPIKVWKKSSEGFVIETVEDAAHLYQKISRSMPPASIGYLSDVGMTNGNLRKFVQLFVGISLLISECTFFAEDRHKARLSAHLCTQDLDEISKLLRPIWLLPMHLSKAYIGNSSQLYEELNPPEATHVLMLPDYLTPRPLLTNELPNLIPKGNGL
jgi:ribonuclease Z